MNPHAVGVSNGAARIGGGERSEPIRRMLIMSYDTESKSRNVLASPLGEEGHEVAKGCTRVRMIMILDVDVTAERRHYNTHRPQGRYHNPQRRRRCRPLSEAMQPFYTTCGASRAPFFIICGEAATTTLGLKGRQT